MVGLVDTASLPLKRASGLLFYAGQSDHDDGLVNLGGSLEGRGGAYQVDVPSLLPGSDWLLPAEQLGEAPR